jgi:hypothetical protein
LSSDKTQDEKHMSDEHEQKPRMHPVRRWITAFVFPVLAVGWIAVGILQKSLFDIGLGLVLAYVVYLHLSDSRKRRREESEKQDKSETAEPKPADSLEKD